MRRLVLMCALLLLSLSAVAAANTSHAGWPPIDNLLIDHDNAGGDHVLRAVPGVHNELLGSYGSDTIYGGDAGDVIWTNYQPDFSMYDPTVRYCPRLKEYIGSLTPKPTTPAEIQAVKVAYGQANRACQAQPANTGKPRTGFPPPNVGTVHAGNGNNFIYATDTRNFVWTGTGATKVHASVGGGEIHCQSSKVVLFTSKRALPHYKLFGCKHISFFSVGY